MNVEIIPSLLKGDVTIPPSKSVAHRMLICAALAKGKSEISNLSFSKDITATIEAVKALGAKIEIDGTTAIVDGIKNPAENACIDCCESGSTLRFMIPVAAALGTKTEFFGRGKLPERPITPFLEELPRHETVFDYNGTMPFGISGKLCCGTYRIGGDVSSQFITGLLLALGALEGESRIELTSHLQSKPYVDITVSVLKKFGAEVKTTEKGYTIIGRGGYTPCKCVVEGDYSQAAFFEVANALGSQINILGLDKNSLQGDKKIVEICSQVMYNKNNELDAFELDCSDIPDLVPALAVLASFCKGKSRITNVARLRIKECDRLEAISQCLNKTGGRVTEFPDSLEIEGVKFLSGGEVDSFNDHRIPMAMAIAATKSKSPILIKNAECVSKSYPDFFEVYEKLGGKIRRF